MNQKSLLLLLPAQNKTRFGRGWKESFLSRWEKKKKNFIPTQI